MKLYWLEWWKGQHDTKIELRIFETDGQAREYGLRREDADWCLGKWYPIENVDDHRIIVGEKIGG